jgi:hypothetical protein
MSALHIMLRLNCLAELCRLRLLVIIFHLHSYSLLPMFGAVADCVHLVVVIHISNFRN